MTDRTTKILLAIIALGLWANVSIQVFQPASVAAQDIARVESKVSDIEAFLEPFAQPPGLAALARSRPGGVSDALRPWRSAL